ncbi:MAG: DCC1-like thiol-disulfide oxidoreductase family protein [Alphaproteobacteria bacterium]
MTHLRINHENSYIVLFDGMCVLCNRWARLIRFFDKKNFYTFVPLQTKEARQFLEHCGFDPDCLDTIYLLDGCRIRTKFEASMYALFYANNLFLPLIILNAILPKILSNFFYDLVGKNRYQLFGQEEACFLPAQADLERLQDVKFRHFDNCKRNI